MTTGNVYSMCDCVPQDVIADALLLLDACDLVQLAAVEPNILQSLRAIRWVFHARRCLPAAELGVLSDLGVEVRLDSHQTTAKGDCSLQWVAPDGQYHREADLPAIIALGYQAWYHHGLPHRAHDRPAFEEATYGRRWYFRGVLHRDGDLPAVEYTNGRREWWVMGKRFRKDGKHVIERSNGDREWRDDTTIPVANRKNNLPSVEITQAPDVLHL
jgi:hypothetical protein